MRPGLYCGLILLTSVENAEPLAFINDGHLQHMRVGADGGIGVKYLANEDAEVVGMLGSGGMARTHMQAFTRVRKIEKLQVFSPTQENRERFGREMAEKYNIEVKVCEPPGRRLQGRAHPGRAHRLRGRSHRRHSARERHPHRRGRRHRQAGRREPEKGRPLPALRRYAGAHRPSRARHRRRACRLRGAAAAR